MSSAQIVGAAILAGVGLLLITTALSYNRFVRQRNLVAESWRQIDVELVRRHDLVPQLVAVVKGYAAHERALFERVAAERAQAVAPSSTVADQGADEARLTAGLRHLFALSEGYPALRADGHFRALQDELVDTEDRIAAARRFYNGNVRALNTRVESIPSSLVAALVGIRRADYFLADEADVRTVPALGLR
jgi:LemA protein